MKPAFLTAVIGAFAAAACVAEEERAPDWVETPEMEAARLLHEAACANWPDPHALYDAAWQGDLGAIDCEIASDEWRFAASTGYEYVDYYRLQTGYRRWQVSGERDERALTAARNLPRFEVAGEVAYHGYRLRKASNPDEPLLPHNPCWELNDIQLELVRVAIPDEESAPCLESWGIDD
ncbi:hypothetical protein X907_0275 [Glycocaulis alkaliphilus]|uniref:Uncharacterized protein n=1 Tax=Glycocaulis alkaliphilus TaxID=1434191 RepID=A0A3T0E665_9PROT|nr:hypothetical protein [Glycocaulis alkaliphilus]AZU02823.1 hypothetical protein X907_0275 [Glycocaulis alkaliphilus]GGB85028.1 hypothetical protein GCM10007417_26310 [Glycocaulis alkaliphilus]